MNIYRRFRGERNLALGGDLHIWPSVILALEKLAQLDTIKKRYIVDLALISLLSLIYHINIQTPHVEYGK